MCRRKSLTFIIVIIAGSRHCEELSDKFETFHVGYTRHCSVRVYRRRNRQDANSYMRRLKCFLLCRRGAEQSNQCTQSNIIYDGWNGCNRTTTTRKIKQKYCRRSMFSSTFIVNICSVCPLCHKSDSVLAIIVGDMAARSC